MPHSPASHASEIASSAQTGDLWAPCRFAESPDTTELVPGMPVVNFFVIETVLSTQYIFKLVFGWVRLVSM